MNYVIPERKHTHATSIHVYMNPCIQGLLMSIYLKKNKNKTVHGFQNYLPQGIHFHELFEVPLYLHKHIHSLHIHKSNVLEFVEWMIY